MMSATVTADTRAAVQSLGMFKGALYKIYPGVCDQRAMLICQQLYEHSYPAEGNDPGSGTGGTTSALEQGSANIEADINSMFVPGGRAMVGNLIMQRNFAAVWSIAPVISWRSESIQRAWDSRDNEALYNVFKNAGWEAGPKITFTDVPTETLYRKMRDKATGSVKKEILQNPDLRVHIRDQLTLNVFIANRIKTIGKMANGWLECVEALGGKAQQILPGKGKGDVKKTGSGMDYGVTCTNHHGDFNGMMSKTGVVEKVMTRQGELFKWDLERKVRNLIASIWSLNNNPAGGQPGSGPTPPPTP